MRIPTVRGTRLRFPEANQAAPFIFQATGITERDPRYNVIAEARETDPSLKIEVA